MDDPFVAGFCFECADWEARGGWEPGGFYAITELAAVVGGPVVLEECFVFADIEHVGFRIVVLWPSMSKFVAGV